MIDARTPPVAPSPADAPQRPPLVDARTAPLADALPKLADAGTPKPDAAPKPDAGVKAKPDAAKPQQMPATEGTADAEELQAAVRARAAQTTQCYETAAKDDPTLSGLVTLQIKIDANGRVTSATADGMTEGLQACLVAQVKSIKFPKPADPPVSLIVPFRFQHE